MIWSIGQESAASTGSAALRHESLWGTSSLRSTKSAIKTESKAFGVRSWWGMCNIYSVFYCQSGLKEFEDFNHILDSWLCSTHSWPFTSYCSVMRTESTIRHLINCSIIVHRINPNHSNTLCEAKAQLPCKISDPKKLQFCGLTVRRVSWKVQQFSTK